VAGVDLERLGPAQHPPLPLGHPPAQPEGVAAPADPGADLEIIAGQLLAQLPADRGQVVLARVQPPAGRAPPAGHGPLVGVADQQRPPVLVDQQAAHGLADRVDGGVGGDLGDQAAGPPVGQPGDLTGGRHQRRHPGEVLVLGRPGLGGHGHRHPQPAGVVDSIPQPRRQPPGVPVAPAPLVGAAPVEPRGRAEQDHRRPAHHRLGPGKVDLALGAEGDPEPDRPQLEHPGALSRLVALLALAQVALAVDAAEAAVVPVELGDVEGRAGALGDAEHRRHPVRQVAASSARTGSVSTSRARSGWARGSTDPVSESSGNTASWQPWARACSSAARCRARLPSRSPFRASVAATRMRNRSLLSSDDRPPGCRIQRSSTA
jgi:hypothetical protein